VIPREAVVELVARMAVRPRVGSEADIQSDVRALLLWGGLNLEESGVIDVNLETPAGLRRRIDVEAGCAIIEVKKDLRVARVAESAVEQLAGYVRHRTAETGQRYVGMLTDGAEWRLYHLEPSGELALASSVQLQPASTDVDGLTVWLEAILATRTEIPPTPAEIERRLGASSSAFALDRAELSALYQAARSHPEIALKRELYAKLLTTAFGTQFTNDDRLFVEHTLLVVMAELIAHVVLGVRITDLQRDPRALVTGTAFHEAGIGGVVEADFFDWVVEASGGPEWVRSLARRIARFAWKEADHDVLKVLYESIIDSQQRHRLGEYYTPDWLAERVVAEVVAEPLTTRCADVSCGSGTFLFHAIRQHLGAAAAAGLSNREAIRSVVGHVFGIDVHPVAVTLARVTYLLAVGTERLAEDHDAFAVPVYLGDSVQWRHEESLLSEGHVAVKTSDGGGLFSDELRFPVAVVADADKFDRLVGELTSRATDTGRPRGTVPDIGAILDRHELFGADRRLVEGTFGHLCQLQDEGRDEIWGYYVRNLVRPVWLAQEQHRVDVLVGNPPWLAYRFMTAGMQREFRTLSAERGLWAGRKVATHQDLSALFVVRAVEQYLRVGGRFGFVMPEAVLSRLAYAGFRSGDWSSASAQLHVAFDQPWTLGRIKPPIFFVPSCVVTGVLSRSGAARMPADAAEWRGRKPATNASWAAALETIEVEARTVQVAGGLSLSPYHDAFTQGATILPRVLVVVENAPAVGMLGTPRGQQRVTSRPNPNEKRPWKGITPLTHPVERRFVRPLHLGKTLLPFRCIEPWLAVIPWDGTKLLSGEAPELSGYPGLEAWWREAELIWMKHRTSPRMTLLDRLDYQHGLSKQLATPGRRVVYNASGQYLAAARVDDPDAVIDHKLYWAHCESLDEARYLLAVLNSPVVTERLAPLQSRGEHNPRDFHKIVFQLPIPRYDESSSRHQQLAQLGQRGEELIASVDLSQGAMRFEAVRRRCRRELESKGLLRELDDAVGILLGGYAPLGAVSAVVRPTH
jgi:SAM-dependent methyltransferase